MYTIVKILVRCGLALFFRKIVYSDPSLLRSKGPLLLACNHPNSFLDAILLGAYFKAPVHFLARGDVFKKSLPNKLLTALNAIPIYRLSEGKEHLDMNAETFATCVSILQRGGIVLIFVEGLCRNEWKLRSLKKGGARIALQTWQLAAIKENFRVLPVGLNYSSYNGLCKNVLIQFGLPVYLQDLDHANSEAGKMVLLNELLYNQLAQATITAISESAAIPFLLSNAGEPKNNKTTITTLLKQKQSALLAAEKSIPLEHLLSDKRIIATNTGCAIHIARLLLFALPAISAFVVHAPFYWPIQLFIRAKTKGTVFYHSALFSICIITYPLYLIVVASTAAIYFNQVYLLALVLILPACGYTFLPWLSSLIRIINTARLSKTNLRYYRKVLQHTD